MIKVSSLSKYGLNIHHKDVLSVRGENHCVSAFSPRPISDGVQLFHHDVLIDVSNDDATVESIKICDVVWGLWTHWRPSMQWLVQQELTGYKDETDYFGESIPTETPEEKEAFEAIDKREHAESAKRVSEGSNGDKIVYTERKIAIGSGVETDRHSNGFSSRCVVVPTKPVFIQAMADAGKLPPVGYKLKFTHDIEGAFKHLHSEQYGWEHGDNLEIIHTTENHYGESAVIVLNAQCDVLTTAVIIDPSFFDTRTEREKAIKEMFNVSYPNKSPSALLSVSLGRLYDAGYRK